MRTNSMMSPGPDDGHRKISANLEVSIMAHLLEKRIHEVRSDKFNIAGSISDKDYSRDFLTIKFDGGRRWGHSTLAALLAERLSTLRPVILVPTYSQLRELSTVGVRAVVVPDMAEKLRGFWYDLIIVDEAKSIAKEDLDALPLNAVKVLLG